MISTNSIIENINNIGANTDIWHFSHIRDSAIIGNNCTIGSHCYIDKDVIIGNNCKIQSGCLIYHPAKIGNCVFIGPRCLIINDKYPKATKDDGTKLTEQDWICEGVIIEDFASIGAGSIIMPGVIIGHHAIIGAGSIVTKNIKPYSKAYGSPAKVY
ncbi:MAG: N-acetyltransferase [Alphaproteobacteria bacterium]|nr:N-acetyltransferase [Alphaproteobacteria bacterium]